MEKRARAERGWRVRHLIMGGAIAFVLLAPLIGMRLSDEVNWTLSDFVAAGVLVAVVSGAYELAAQSNGDRAYRAGVLAALAGGFLTIWADGAVGIIGDGSHPINWTFRCLPLIPLAGGLIVRFRPRGMALTMLATAAAQALAGGVAFAGGWDHRGAVLSCFFIVPWLLSAVCFRHAASEG